MNYEFVLTEKKDKVGIITLNRPPANRYNLQMFRDVKAALEEMDADYDVLCIMIKGAGEYFSLGGDPADIVEADDWEANEFFLALIACFKTFRSVSKPIIGVVHSQASAAGMMTALSCDLIVASENASFGATAIKFGLFCFFGPPTMLPPLIGQKRAFEMGVTGELVPARTAYEWGMINRVVPREKLDETAWELANTITNSSPTAILLGKRCMYACQDVEYHKALDHGASVMFQYQQTEEAKEGMRAFLENRKPNFNICATCSDFSIKRKRPLKGTGG